MPLPMAMCALFLLSVGVLYSDWPSANSVANSGNVAKLGVLVNLCAGPVRVAVFEGCDARCRRLRIVGLEAAETVNVVELTPLAMAA